MIRFWRLYKGEIHRLFKYKIIFFGFLVSIIWIIIVALSDQTTAQALVPTLIVMDAGMMSIILLAASFFFEKQEGTIKTLFVTPVPLSWILLAKVASAMTSGILSMLLVAGSAWIVHGIATNLLLMGIYVLFIVAGNTAIGYVFILSSKDFLSMLVKLSMVLILFYIPSMLVPLGIIPKRLEFIALISPVYSGSFLIESLYSDLPTAQIVFAIVYLGVVSTTIYPFVVYKKYQKVAVQG